MITLICNLIIMTGSEELFNDLWFTIKYVPLALGRGFKYCIYGALIGFASSFLLKESLKTYARENHDYVDILDKYVPDEEEYFKFNRGPDNKVTPPISNFLPIYGSLIGAGAGAFFALHRAKIEFHQELQQERQTRILDMV